MHPGVRPSSAARLATEDDRQLRAARLAEFVGWMIPVAIGFAGLYVGAGLLLPQRSLTLAGVDVMGFAVALFVARGWLRTGRLEAAAELVALGLCVMCVIGAPLIPWMRAPLLLIPVAAIALVLPDLQPGSLRRLLILTFCSEVAIVTLATVMRDHGPRPPAWLQTLVIIAASTIAIGLTFLLLWRDANRLRHSIATADFHALRLRAVIDRAPIVAFALDREARFTVSEGSGLETFGLHPGEAVGRSVFSLYGEVDWFRAAVERALRGETVFATGAFAEKYFEVYLRPMADGAIGVTTDVTHREEAARRLRLLSDASRVLAERSDSEEDVLDRVARIAVQSFATECTIDLTNEGGELRRVAMARRHVADADPRTTISAPLLARGGSTLGVLMLSSSERSFTEHDTVLAEDLAARAAIAIEAKRLYDDAQRAVRVRDEFLSIASHELKTPLTPLRLQTTAIERAIERGEVARIRDKAGGLHRQVDRITKLVDELLDVGRLRAGRLSLDCREANLDNIVRAVVARMLPELERAGCPINVHVEGDPVGCWDESRIDQIVTNLVSNAMKYGPNAPIAIDVRGERDDVWVTVQDRGIGISAEDQTRIFRRFERAVSDRNYGGLGLGLFIVHELVTAHGGEVSVRSAPGEGATFVVRLPRNATRTRSAS